MQKKSFISSINKRELQIFSNMMQMKFKPASNQATVKLVNKNKQILQKYGTELQHSRSTVSRMVNKDKKLKYLNSLSSDCFLVGNQNQVDMICILGITHSFVDTDYCWSLPVLGPIDYLAIQQRKSLIAIVSEKKLYFYRYNGKKSKQTPELIKQFDIKLDVKYIQFPKDSYLALFSDKQFEIYNVEELNKIHKKCQKTFGQPKGFKLFSVPQAVQNSLKVFFTEEQGQNHDKTFGLWYMKINIQVGSVSTVVIQKPQKVYDIKRNLKKFLVIQNFSKDIIFMNIGAEILAAKNGYILDSANVNIQSDNAKLKYISNQRLVHISDRKVEIYKMNILTNVTPNKIQIIPVDALQIRDKPQQSQYFGLMNFMNDNFAIFYQNKSQFNIYTKGQASYWFALSQSIPLQQKIQRIFDCGVQISKLNPELLQQKCDMARKMGLNQKQLYLQIWNRSNKNSIADYQFILATRNYKTIHVQIQKKLKKQSMSFRQLLKIQQSCLEILRQGVYGPKCTEQNIQQFLASHCFIKKLKLYKDIQIYNKNVKKSTIRLNSSRDQEEDNNRLLITIQKYYQYKQFDIKTYLIQKIVQFSVLGKSNRSMQIRFMIRTFKFIYRVIYKQILQDIIRLCKVKLIVLLESIPQILPYNHMKMEQELQQNQDLNLYQGIWNDIKQTEWKNNLYVENITTIDNKQCVKQFVKSIWYRRYYLTAHQLVNQTKDKINQINDSNNSQYIFYFFIRKVFQLIPDRDAQFQIILYLEQHYSKIPQHLKGKIFLHANLHKYYVQNHAKAKLQPMQLDVFLNQDDAKLFEYFFTQQKHTKNCILKQIKKIYQQTCQQGQGLILFNQGLLAYFKSQLSQISDLKYLLNRMNNQKTQFHQANLSIYQVLVRAMQYKLKLGTQEDIPIDQVLIYIQNIPIARDNEVMKQLYIVQKINQEAERFKKMKINMTIKQIIDNCEDVISKIVEYQFEVNKIRSISDQEILKQKTYKILAQVLVVKQKLYGDDYATLPFFVYLTKLLQDISQIRLANVLLEDQFLRTHFPIDQMMKQNLLLFMYKWTFDHTPAFRANYQYLKQLITILPQENQNRLFIQSQIQFAMALSTMNEPLQYPISTQSQYPRMSQLNQILKYLPIQHVLKVDIDMIYKNINTMQSITLKVNVPQQNDFQLGSLQKITPHQVYSVFINKYIESNHLNDVIPLMKKLLTLQIKNKRFNMIFFITLILKLSTQLNDESKGVMIKTMFYCYDQPQILFQFVEYYFNSKQTALQKSKKLKIMMEQYTKNKLNFAPNNILFNLQSQKALSNPQLKQKSKALINSICNHLRQTKQQFQNSYYDILFSILCNEPFMVAKYIQMNQYTINFKVLRSYLSFLIQQSIFDQQKVIQFCKIIFSMILQSNVKGKDIAKMILNPDKFYFNWAQIKQIGITEEIDRKVEKTLKNFEKKKKSLGLVMSKKLSSAKQTQNDIHHIHLQLKNPQELSSKQPSQYPFSDSDNDLAQQQSASPSRQLKKKSKKQTKNFDKKKQRNKLMKRKNSFFADKSNEKKKSRNQQQQMQDFIDLSNNKAVSLKVPQTKPNKIYVKRSLTNDQSPSLTKKNVSTISQKQKQESEINTRNNRRNGRDSFLSRHKQQDSKLSKQQSQYSVNQISQVQQQQPSYRIKDLIIKNYDNATDKIDFDVLSKQQAHQDFQVHLKDVIIKIYQDRQIQNQNKLKIIKQICSKYNKVSVNTLFLAVYQNIKRIQQAYNLGLPINRLLPVDGLFLQSKVLDELFKLVLPRIIQISSDETIFKLTKLVSLGFNKNVYEAEVSFEYIKKMISQFLTGHTEVQLNMRLQIMRSLINKLSVLVLKQKASELLKGIIANPDLQRKIIENVAESVKKRGNSSAAEQIRKIMQAKN